MPGRILQTAAAAVVLAISIPVLSFAVLTSMVALFLVGVRASVLSSEFWITVFVESWHHHADQPVPRRPALQKLQSSIEFRPPMPRSRTNSFVDAKRLSHRSDSHVSLVGTPINRDFEGVGGWRTRDDDDQSLWTNMTSRLERTRSSSRHHRRSITGTSLQSTALNSPELIPLRTPKQRPGTSGTSGSASPQSYFNLPLPSSRSMVSLQQQKRFSGAGSDRWDFARDSRPESLDLNRETEDIGVAL